MEAGNRQILDDALFALKRLPGVKWGPTDVRWPPGKGVQLFDAEVTLRGDGHRQRFLTTVRRFLRGLEALAWVREAQWRAERAGERFLLVTRYCAPPTAERLAAENVNFLDAAGNVHLKMGDLTILVTGRKIPRERTRGTTQGILITPGALRVIYLVLAEPKRAWRIQEIARAAGHGVGWTHAIVQALVDAGLLRRTRPRGPVVALDRERLLARWIADYPVALRPKLALGRYAPVELQGARPALEEPAERYAARGRVAEDVATGVADVAARVRGLGDRGQTDRRIVLGGTWGADALVRFYRGARLVLHVDPPAHAWMEPLRIVPDDRGPITLLAPVVPRMWEHAIPTAEGPVAPPLILYAELRADPDPRAQELAVELARKFPEVSGGH